jgi:U1 small nuclear ribonucleoprotein
MNLINVCGTQLKIVYDREGKSTGYAFAEFEHERDMLCSRLAKFMRACILIAFPLAAYKKMDGHKIDGRRVVVDVERARTVKEWLPRRLGTCSHLPMQHARVLLLFCFI